MSVGKYKDGKADETIYELPYDAPIAYAYETYMDLDEAEEISVLDINALLLKCAFVQGRDVNEISIDKADISKFMDSCNWKEIPCNIDASDIMPDGEWYTFNGENSLIVRPETEFSMDSEKEYYILLDGLRSTNGIALVDIEGKELRFTPQLESANAKGEFLMKIPMTKHVVENKEIYITPEQGNYQYDSVKVIELDISGYDKDFDILTKYIVEDFEEVGANTLSGKVSNNADVILVMSILYDDAWQCYVDGQRKESIKVNHGLLGVCIPQGEHEIIWRYQSDLTNICMYVGVFVAGLAVCVSLIQRHGINTKKRMEG